MQTGEESVECRFATYCKSKDNYNDDLHVVKEHVHRMGEIIPRLRLIKNLKRSYYVTKKAFRNHEDKKEWEDIDKLDRFESTQRELGYNIAKSLNIFGFKGNTRELFDSPYLYGADISSTALLKHHYNSKCKNVSYYTNAVFDTETDMVNGTGAIIMATVSFKNKLICAVHEDFVAGRVDVVENIKKIAKELIGDILEKRKINIEIVLVKSEVDIIKTTMAKAHEWKPDFMSVWNLSFDMNKMISAFEKANEDIALTLSDPSIPYEYKSFRWKEGPAKKVTASGVVMSYKPSDRWHSVFCPSSFYWIDAMCAYRKVRIGSAEEPSYSLDSILQKELKIKKLKFEAAAQYENIPDKWHWFMQSNYPLQYIVYNMFDCISMEMLDEKTNDLSLSMPMFCGSSDFNNFNSQPKRLADSLHNFCLKNGKVIGTTSSQMSDDIDTKTFSLSEWIVMLPSHLVEDNGLQLIEENPNLKTNIRICVADLDVAGSYPNGGAALNISKESTKKELIKVGNVPERLVRMSGINLSSGFTNATEIATSLFGLPQLDEMLDKFIQQ